jgi:hypothetical protein
MPVAARIEGAPAPSGPTSYDPACPLYDILLATRGARLGAHGGPQVAHSNSPELFGWSRFVFARAASHNPLDNSTNIDTNMQWEKWMTFWFE